MWRFFLSYVRGDWPKWFFMGVWSPVLTAVIFALLSMSAAHFDGGYDWRFQVMCKLGSAKANPDGWMFWSLALSLTCIMAIPSAGYFRARLGGSAPGLSGFSSGALWVGYIAGLIVGLEGLAFPALNGFFHKAHESCATVCFAAICLGALGFWMAAMRWLSAHGRWSARGCLLISLLVAVPFAGAMLSQAYLFFVPNDLGWVGPEWVQLGIPVYMSFAFWEWMATVGIYLCLYIMIVVLPSRPPEPFASAL